MRRLLVKLFLILLPVAVIMAFPTFVMWQSGELLPPDLVIAQQASTPSLLYGFAYSNNTPYYKLKVTEELRPDVLVLGTSRVMQFRREMFQPGVSFYNAGGAVSRIDHFRTFLATMDPSYAPNVLIIGIDPWMLNPNYHNGDVVLTDGLGTLPQTPADRAALLVSNWTSVYTDYLARKFTIPEVLYDRHGTLIGLTAHVRVEGFRQDGSYSYNVDRGNPSVRGFTDYRFRQTLSMIASGQGRFAFGDRVDSAAVERLSLLLREQRQRDVHVVVFIPPLPHATHEAFWNDPRRTYVRNVAEVLRATATSGGATFADLSDMASVGAGDPEAVDGLHGSEKTYARILVRLSRQDPALGDRVAVGALERALATSRDRFRLFDVPKAAP